MHACVLTVRMKTLRRFQMVLGSPDATRQVVRALEVVCSCKAAGPAVKRGPASQAPAPVAPGMSQTFNSQAHTPSSSLDIGRARSTPVGVDCMRDVRAAPASESLTSHFGQPPTTSKARNLAHLSSDTFADRSARPHPPTSWPNLLVSHAPSICRRLPFRHLPRLLVLATKDTLVRSDTRIHRTRTIPIRLLLPRSPDSSMIASKSIRRQLTLKARSLRPEELRRLVCQSTKFLCPDPVSHSQHLFTRPRRGSQYPLHQFALRPFPLRLRLPDSFSLCHSFPYLLQLISACTLLLSLSRLLRRLPSKACRKTSLRSSSLKSSWTRDSRTW
jgi:hypothetical protein